MFHTCAWKMSLGAGHFQMLGHYFIFIKIYWNNSYFYTKFYPRTNISTFHKMMNQSYEVHPFQQICDSIKSTNYIYLHIIWKRKSVHGYNQLIKVYHFTLEYMWYCDLKYEIYIWSPSPFLHRAPKSFVSDQSNKGMFCYVNELTFGPHLRMGAG